MQKANPLKRDFHLGKPRKSIDKYRQQSKPLADANINAFVPTLLDQNPIFENLCYIRM